MSGAPDAPDHPAAQLLLKALGPVSTLASAAGTLWIFVLMLVINADVIGRAMFNTPLPGVPEIVAQSIVGIVFLQMADAQRRGRLIRSDVFLARIIASNPTGGRLLLSLHNIAGAVLMALILVFGWERLVNAWVNEEYVGTMGTFTLPLWPIAAIIVLAAALSMLYHLLFAVFARYAQVIELEGGGHV